MIDLPDWIPMKGETTSNHPISTTVNPGMGSHFPVIGLRSVSLFVALWWRRSANCNSPDKFSAILFPSFPASSLKNLSFISPGEPLQLLSIMLQFVSSSSSYVRHLQLVFLLRPLLQYPLLFASASHHFSPSGSVITLHASSSWLTWNIYIFVFGST